MNFFKFGRFSSFQIKLPLTPRWHEIKVKIFFLTFLFVISCSHTVSSQYVNNADTIHHIDVISDILLYKSSVKKNSENRMVRLKEYLHPLITDFKYATYNNFTHRILYTHPEAYLRLPVAMALQKVQKELKAKGLALKIFDAYRPYSVTKEMWKVVPDQRYAANPAKGSGHNRGEAVDLTLVKVSSGEELPMPTGFDDFTEKAHHSYRDLPEDVLQNRALLKTTMEKYGFRALSTEWWQQ